jgi:methyl-accepting chemotaxis protein
VAALIRSGAKLVEGVNELVGRVNELVEEVNELVEGVSEQCPQGAHNICDTLFFDSLITAITP